MLDENRHIEFQTSPLAPEPKSGFFDRSQKVIWLAVITAAVAVIGLLSYVLFFKNAVPRQDFTGDLDLRVAAAQELPSGSEISYRVSYENLTNTKLTDLSLEVFYPQGFSFVDSIPDPGPEYVIAGRQVSGPRSFRFADLPAGGKGEVVLTGSLSGTVQESKTMSVKFHYTPENFRSTFSEQAAVSTVILAPDLALLITAPAQIITGGKVEYDVRLTNLSQISFEKLKLKFDFPDGFEPEKSSLEGLPDTQGREWVFPAISPGEEISFKIFGRISAEAGKEVLIFAELLRNAKNGEELLSRSFAVTEVKPAPLFLSQRMVGTGESLGTGGEVKYEIAYKNTSQTPLQGVTIAFNFDSDVFDFTRVQSPTGQIQVSDFRRSLIFTPALNAELRTVNPGKEGKFSFTAGLKSDLPSTTRQPTAKSSLAFKSAHAPEYVSGPVLEKKMKTSMRLAARLLPVAPKVYRVELSVTNTLNDLVEAEFALLVPRADVVVREASIAPADERSAVRYSPNAGTVTWNLGRVFAFTGSFHEPRTLSFELEITGDNQQSALPLVENIAGFGQDDWTGERIEGNKIESLRITN